MLVNTLYFDSNHMFGKKKNHMFGTETNSKFRFLASHNSDRVRLENEKKSNILINNYFS